MKFPNLINSTQIIAWINSMPKITSFHPAKNHNSPSIKIAVNSDAFPKNSTNVNYLKPFDSAFIAYYMMGYGNFE
ncbi:MULTISPECIES: hypothetical protein [unclassified Nostoc]|uniref:hypothetical protein n=1 Tax=unclassified Nostoc TaxID=2593658 RepID=UPI002AD237F4|nr:hypothetical protein [Nostoc sp. DedQUE03]MDZ7973451.1 hypothetical protein [Nostoc sp. DedQUE03]MDZ8045067.1 hypothetical protein [Nostoc sp. DedQUE02]